VVTTEGDLSVAVSGLIIKDLCSRPIHFWENLMFDEEKNWVLGGHEGGSAGFSMAKKGTRPKLRNTQYINFGKIPGAPYHGVVPEFITNPGPVNLMTVFRGESGYEMRIARGESVDLPPFEVHYEHTVFRPNVPLSHYFRRIAEIGICHHFALVHAEISHELEKVAEIIGMKLEYLTD
jgi:L-arabinose isomerase